MYADFIHLINFEKGLKKPFIYVVEPVGRDEEEAEVESSTDVLQAQISDLDAKIDNIDNRFEELKSLIEKNKVNDDRFEELKALIQ